MTGTRRLFEIYAAELHAHAMRSFVEGREKASEEVDWGSLFPQFWYIPDS